MTFEIRFALNSKPPLSRFHLEMDKWVRMEEGLGWVSSKNKNRNGFLFCSILKFLPNRGTPKQRCDFQTSENQKHESECWLKKWSQEWANDFTVDMYGQWVPISNRLMDFGTPIRSLAVAQSVISYSILGTLCLAFASVHLTVGNSLFPGTKH